MSLIESIEDDDICVGGFWFVFRKVLNHWLLHSKDFSKFVVDMVFCINKLLLIIEKKKNLNNFYIISLTNCIICLTFHMSICFALEENELKYT